MENIQNENLKKRKLENNNSTTIGIGGSGNGISREEQLFWKVYKNIFLKRKILNNLSPITRYPNGNISFKSSSKKYHEINSVEWMLRNNHSQLLRYKVLHDDKDKSLSFNYGNNGGTIERNETRMKYDKLYISNYGDTEVTRSNFKYHFFNVIKEKSNENIEFYKRLFTNYPEYFQTSLDYTVYLLTEYDCIAALVVCIEEFGYVPDLTMFKRCIGIGSFSCSSYIKNHYKFGNSLIVDLIGGGGYNGLNKFWKEMLFDKDIVIQMVMSRPTEINSRVKHIVSTDDGLNIKLPTASNNKYNILNKGIGHIFRCTIYNLKLVELLECTYTIHSLYPLLKKFIKSISDNKYIPPELGDYSNSNVIEYFHQTFNGIPILSIDQINEVKSSFTENQLKSNVYETSNKFKSVKQIYEMVLLFTDTRTLQNNFSFYQSKYCNKLITGSDSIKFGQFVPGTFQSSDLFKYCCTEHDKDIAEKYIDDWLTIYQNGDYMDQQIFIDSFLSNKMFTMELLVKLVSGCPELIGEKPYNINCIYNIQSVEQFDYFFKYWQSQISNNNCNERGLNIFSLVVSSTNGGLFIGYLKSNHQEYYKKLVSHLSSKEELLMFSKSSLMAIHENKKDFPADYHCFYSIGLGNIICKKFKNNVRSFDWLNCNFSSNEISTLISNGLGIQYSATTPPRLATTKKNWLFYNFLNFRFSTENGNRDYNSFKSAYLIDKSKGTIDWLVMEMLGFVATTGDLELLDFALSIHSTGKFNFELLIKVLLSSNLEIFKSIYNHSSQLFKDLGSLVPINSDGFKEIITILLERDDIYLFNEVYPKLKFDFDFSKYKDHSWLTQYLHKKK